MSLSKEAIKSFLFVYTDFIVKNNYMDNYPYIIELKKLCIDQHGIETWNNLVKLYYETRTYPYTRDLKILEFSKNKKLS